MSDSGKIETPEPKYLAEYDVTVWEYDDHVLVAFGNVRDANNAAVQPVWIKKTGGKYDLSRAFTTEVEIDVEGIEAEDVTPEPRKKIDPEPEESMY